jgi:hypothetical protein
VMSELDGSSFDLHIFLKLKDLDDLTLPVGQVF